MTLDATKYAGNYKSVVEVQINKAEAGDTLFTPQELSNQFSDIYAAYVSEGELAGGNLAAGGTISILKNGMAPSRDTSVVATLATAIAGYWSSCITVGVPSHGGTAVVSVTIPIAASAVQSALESINVTPYSEDAYKAMFEAVETVVKATPCSIVEMMPTTPPAPATFIEFIS